MDKLARTEKLTAQVSLALAAGMVSIMPVTYGAPVLDKVVAGGANVKVDGKTTAITSQAQNNVIHWQDFSVQQGEKVQFDGGAKQHNYLNLVTGEQTSRINGAIEGGRDVYIVNPHGVVFGKEAKVDVGSLYVSTTKEALDTSKYLATGASPLVDTASAAASDVVNMGTINADKVYVEGGTIKFYDTDKVSATGDAVQLYANTAIDLGHQATVTHTDAGSGEQVISFAQVTPTKKYQTNKAPTDYTNITKDNLFTAVQSTGNYWLTDDIDLENATITPICNDATGFQGLFDGNFYTISNYQVTSGTYGGLFGKVAGGTIQHLGVANATISGTKYSGAIAGLMSSGTITQSFVKSSSVASTNPKALVSGAAGGIVGVMTGGTISESYVSGLGGAASAGGIVGNFSGTLENVYSVGLTGTILGLFALAGNSSGTVTNSYTTAAKTSFGKDGAGTAKAITDTDTYHYADAQDNDGKKIYDGWSLSSKGGESTTWRIYEGQTLPLLRCFLTANGTVNVNYNYTQGDQSGANNGADLTTTYNMQQVQFGTPTYTEKDGGITVDSSLITAPTSSDDYKNVRWDDKNNKAKTWAAFYTAQDGYDLVGNNITIEPRKLTISSSGLGTDPISKQYDGTATVDKAELASRFDAKSGAADGLIAGDTTVTIDTSGLSGQYTKDGKAYAKVDDNLAITLSGGITAKNVDPYHNYDIDNKSDFDGVSLSGSITPKHLKIVAGTGFAVEKTYNGKDNASVEDDDTLAKQIAGGYLTLDGIINKYDDDGNQTSTKEDVSLAASTDSTGTYYDQDGNATGKAGDNYTVKYTGLTLSGDDMGNYVLVNDNDEEITDATYTTTGSISRKKLSTADFLLNGSDSVSREYNGNQYLTLSADAERTVTPASGALEKDKNGNTDDVVFTIATGDHTAWFSKNGAAVSDAGTGYDITYQVNISGDDRENYTLNGSNLENLTTAEVTGATGKNSITPRVLNFVLGSKTSGIDKTYDRKPDVYADANKRTAIELTDNLVAYNSDDADHQLLSGDNVTLAITGAYDDANVKGSASNPEERDITYTVTISGDKAKNYTLKYDKDNPQNVVNSTTVTGAKGTINPVHLTNVALASGANIHKTFDTAKTAGAVDTDKLTIDKVTFDGLVSGDSKSDILTDDVLKTLNSNGNYYKLDSKTNTYVADEHVARDGSGNVTTKKVKYTGLSSASNNYLFDTDTVEGEGTIDALAIKDVTLAKKQAITKVYDGNASVARDAYDPQSQTAQAATEFVGDLSTEVNGHTIKLDYTLKDANYTDDSGAVQKNVGKDTQARFVLQVSTDGDNGDYSLAGGDGANYTLNGDGTITKALTLEGGEGITARHIFASAALTPEKDYDGTTVVKKGGQAISGADVVTLTGLLDADKGDNKSTAAYTDKNVRRTYDAKTGKAGIGTQTVNYTVSLDGDSATNYEVYKAADHSSQVELDKAGALTGDGIINPLKTTVDFSTVTKTYNQTQKLDGDTKADKTGRSLTNLAEVQNVQSGDTVTATVDTANAKFDSADKGIGTRQVTYDFTLNDSGDGVNYDLTNDGLMVAYNDAGARTFTLTVDGNTIKPFTLKDEDIKTTFSKIEKVYDATPTLTDSEKYLKSFSISNITLDAGNGDYTIKSAAYASENVTTKQANYTFQLSAAMAGNFDFSGVTQAVSAVVDGAQEVYAHPEATITPKDLTATLTDLPADSKIVKDYDGTATVYYKDDNGQTHTLSGDALQNKISISGIVEKDKDTVKLDTDKTTALYTDVNASDTANSKTVQYTLALKDTTGGSHAGNYRINYDAVKKQENKVLEGTGTINRRQLTLDVASDALTKTYDRYSTLTDAAKKKIGLSGLQNGETLSLNINDITGNYGTNASTADKADKFEADGSVNWDGSQANAKNIYLKGLQTAAKNGTGTANFATNYKIDDTQFYGIADGKGHINRLELKTDDIETVFKPATEGSISKQYDNTENVLDPEKHFAIQVKAGVIAADSKAVPIEYELQSAVYHDGTNTVKDATTNPVNVVYTIKGIKSTESQNFVMTDTLLHSYDNTTYTGTKLGKITPRHLLVSTQATDEISKVYDGNNTIAQANPKTYNQTKSNVLIENLLTGTEHDDGASVTITPTYADENVSYSGGYSDANVTTKDVNFGLAITGAKASNYVFYNADDMAELSNNTITAEDAGRITPATLTLGDAGVSVADRVYNGQASIDTSGIKFTLDGFKKDADKTLDNFMGNKDAKNLIQGKYVAETAPTEDSYVNRDTTAGEAGKDKQGRAYGYKDVCYSGLNDALQKLREDGNVVARNYKISDTRYFEAALQRGIIRPLAITAEAVRENYQDGTTKVYDGTNYVDKDSLQKHLSYGVVIDANGDVLNKNVAQGSNTWVNIDYELAGNQTRDAAAVYDAGKNVGSDLAITYEISKITPASLQNFDMGDDAQNVIIGTHNHNGAAITPKTVLVHLAQTTGIDKVYDGNAQAETQEMLVIDDGIIDADKGKVNVALTDGYYTNDSGTADKNAGANKNIKYTVTLSKSDAGTDTDKANYTLVAQGAAGYPATGNTQAETETLNATGTIKKRPVYVHFTDDESPTGLDRAYNGSANTAYTTDAAKLKDAQGHVAVVAADDVAKTGFVAGDDVSLDNDAISVNYGDGNVARNSAGQVTTKDVYFANFQAEGGDAANYDLVAADGSSSLTAKDGGTITPLTLNVSLKDANPTREYNGTTEVSAAYAAVPSSTESNVAVDRTNLVTGDSINVSFAQDAEGNTRTPQYADKHVGKNIGVDYFLQWDNQNYELVHTPVGTDTQSTTGTAAAVAGSGLTTTLHTTAGEITPRVLRVQNVAQAEKTYDGTRDVTNAASLITLEDRVVSGDTLGFTATGLYDSAQAAASESGAEQTHSVSYNLAVQNTDYTLADTTATGTGVIHRRGLVITADPASVRAGEAMPAFTGSVSNWASGENGAGDFSFSTEPGVTTMIPGQYAVYGWYNGLTSGNYGQNYTFSQAPANATAFTVELIDPGKEYHENVNPRQQFIPNQTTYSQSSHDGVGGFSKPPTAQVAYLVNQQLVQYAGSADSNTASTGLAGTSLGQNTSLQGAYSAQDTGTVLGSMTIQATDVVNLQGGDRVALEDAEAQTDNKGEIAVITAGDSASISIEQQDA